MSDPLAEKYYNWSNYQYVRGNPALRFDPNGMCDEATDIGGASCAGNRIKVYKVYGGGTLTVGWGKKTDKDDKNKDGQEPDDKDKNENSNDGGDQDKTGRGDINRRFVVRNVGHAASFGSGVIGLTQISMLKYRMSLPLSSKIGTFSRFRITYSGLGKFSGKLGTAGALVSLGFNINDLNAGKTGIGRFSYRTGSIGASIATGTMIGGPWRSAGGAFVGGISIGFEYIYDNIVVPLWNETNRQIYNFENAIKNGWYPGR